MNIILAGVRMYITGKAASEYRGNKDYLDILRIIVKTFPPCPKSDHRRSVLFASKPAPSHLPSDVAPFFPKGLHISICVDCKSLNPVSEPRLSHEWYICTVRRRKVVSISGGTRSQKHQVQANVESIKWDINEWIEKVAQAPCCMQTQSRREKAFTKRKS